jgi:predicted transcriptional regulator
LKKLSLIKSATEKERDGREMVVNEGIETIDSLQPHVSLMTSSPRRIKLDAIASILEIGDMNYNNNNDGLQAKLKELHTDSNELEIYLSLLARKGFIEYDHLENKTYRTTYKGLHILQLYQRVVMWLH